MGFFDFLKSKTTDVWLDKNTGLMWQLDIPSNLMTWDEANQYAHNINQKKYGGFTDWRLPTIEELERVYRYKNLDIAWKYKEKAINIVDFEYHFYWSSTLLGERLEKIHSFSNITEETLTNKAWNICIINALAGYDIRTDHQCVRLVRG